MPGRFLSFFRPIARIMPEVKTSERHISFREKLIWTALAIVAYLVMTEIPLYGAIRGPEDPFFALRVIFASSRGTLMELGIQPIVTAGLVVQLLASSKIIGFDNSNPEDRTLLSGVTKFASILMTSFLAIAYILSGQYGAISVGTQIAIFVQLFMAGIVTILLDELLQKGYGFGSGISLFIATGVLQKVAWSFLSPLQAEADGKLLGGLLAYIQSLLRGEDALQSFVYRSTADLPTMLGFVATIVVLLIAVSLESLKIEIPISYAKFRGFSGRYPVKFLYISNIPVILVSALFMDVYFVSQIIWSRFNVANANPWLNWLGIFEGGQPKGGLAYYLTPPRNFPQFLENPLRAFVYAGLLIGFCVLFAIIWLEVSGMDSRSVAQQLVDSGMQIPGFRRSVGPIQRILDRYIPTVTILGALAVGSIAAFSDFFGVYGTGMGILLTVTILQQLYEAMAKEQMLDAFPLIGQLFG